MLGSDSHTPTPGGLGELAIGSGGLDVAVAMGGGAYYIEMPEVVNVRLEGELPEWATAKDVILELLRRLSVKGGVGKVLEYTGPGVETLTVPERTTITNMGTELGATSSIFPTDDQTKDYLERLGREDVFEDIGPDEDAEYADEIVVDLSDLEPLIAEPSMPDNVVPVSEVEGVDVEQVMIGSCTNGAYEDILPAAKMLEGRNIDKKTEMIVAPGSKQASEMLAREGWTAEMMAAGVNFSEATCGACIGIGHVPASDSVSLRTFNRNFEGRSGIEDDNVYLCSPEVATAAAIKAKSSTRGTSPTNSATSRPPVWRCPTSTSATPNRISSRPTKPLTTNSSSPNIGDVPLKDPLETEVGGEALLKMEDNITTDHIIPATQDILMYRSNVPKLSEFTLSRVDDTFAERALEADGGVLVAGENYGQGSSREHAACADVPGYRDRPRTELRPHPQGEPVQLRYRSAHHRRGDLREDRGRRRHRGRRRRCRSRSLRSGGVHHPRERRLGSDRPARCLRARTRDPRRRWQALAHETAARRRRRCTCRRLERLRT